MNTDYWSDPLALLLIGATLLVIGLIVGWVARAAHARRARHRG